MTRYLIVVIIAVYHSWSSAGSRDIGESCAASYQSAAQYLGRANGQLWLQYENNTLTFEQYHDLTGVNTLGTIDYFWRIIRNSHVGTVFDCEQDAQNIRALVNQNSKQSRN